MTISVKKINPKSTMMSVVSSSTMTISVKKINPKFTDDTGCVGSQPRYLLKFELFSLHK